MYNSVESPFPDIESITPFKQPFPTELLIIIFEMAWEEDRATAFTSTLVSKYFRPIVASLVYHSICVCGTRQIWGLLDLVEREPAIARVIKNLCVEQCNHSYYLLPDERSTMVDTLGRIITPIAPSIEILSFLSPDARHDDIAYGEVFAVIPFPNLRELTIGGNFDLKFPAPLPSLERLHIGVRNTYPLLRDLVHMCPRLTHFKATGFIEEGELLFYTLRKTLGIAAPLESEVDWRDEPSERERSEKLLLPPLIISIILKPDSAVERTVDYRVGRYRNMLRMLDWLEAEAEEGPGLVVEAPGRMSRGDLKDNWRDRLHDGRGCWPRDCNSDDPENDWGSDDSELEDSDSDSWDSEASESDRITRSQLFLRR